MFFGEGKTEFSWVQVRVRVPEKSIRLHADYLILLLLFWAPRMTVTPLSLPSERSENISENRGAEKEDLKPLTSSFPKLSGLVSHCLALRGDKPHA